MTRSPLRRGAATLALSAVLATACSAGPDEVRATVAVNTAQVDGGGWSVLATPADEVERFATLAELGRIADVVLIAQPTGVDGVRRVGPEGLGGHELAQLRFAVVRAVSEWDEDEVVLEVDVPAAGVEALEEQVAGFPPALLAVRAKVDEEAGRYRLVSSRALWTEQPGGGLVAPVAEKDLGGALVERLAEVDTLDELGDHLDAARAECDPECGLAQAAWNR